MRSYPFSILVKRWGKKMRKTICEIHNTIPIEMELILLLSFVCRRNRR